MAVHISKGLVERLAAGPVRRKVERVVESAARETRDRAPDAAWQSLLERAERATALAYGLGWTFAERPEIAVADDRDGPRPSGGPLGVRLTLLLTGVPVTRAGVDASPGVPV
ncbi:hypothetical protein C1I98_38535 [Spongiactinospora gelatinilytica]|uniref:Uncharacterized protein n=1 Tax=Spongiactinospora gelatinilytica TaxID=2666298 RepID=A0A2W2EWJ1_9ACTN|nr:hypothetical protein [Spongiactinospora gelatinilytica]PZG17920.1 hypothetical protein C1I98_38535 [Spongiactinospora gelatinilytica]